MDTNPSSHHAGRFSYFYNKWGRSGSDQGGNYGGSNAVRLESIAVPLIPPTVTSEDKETYNCYQEHLNNGTLPLEIRKTYRVLANGEILDSDAGALTETRFYSPSLVSTVHGEGGSTTTAVYLAYYDSVQKQMRFRYSSEVPAGKLDKDNFVDNQGYIYNGSGYQNYMEANTEKFSLIAGVDTQQGEAINNEFSETVSVNKTDAEGNNLHKIACYRRAEIGENGALAQNKNTTEYALSNLKITNSIRNAMKTEDLKNRFTVNQTVNCIKNGNYYWIIQPDGLIYYSSEASEATVSGYKTHRTSGYRADEKCLDNRKLDPDLNYIVYEKVPATEGNEYNDGNPLGQPPFFWPYAKDGTVVKVDIPVHEIDTYYSYDTGYSAYKYVAIDAMAGSDAAHDTVVAVWYDGTNCLYAYNDNPTSGKDNGSAGGWKGNKVIFTEGGEHCTVKLDPNGGVHIAAYVDGCLRYAYLSSCDADYSEATDSVKVDSFTITGERITLDVGKDAEGHVIPYISYFNGTARLPSVARLIVPENGIMNYRAHGTGTIDGDDMFTGNWEISLVPSPMTLTTNYYDKVNVCLWKKNGTIVSGNDAGFTVTGGASGKTSANNTSGTTNGNIYGNGTAYPIMGYAVESNSGTNLETAQMR